MNGIYTLRRGRLHGRPSPVIEWPAYGMLVIMALLALFSLQVHSIKLQSVHSNALQPALQSGDAIILHRVSISDLSPQDIVSYIAASTGHLQTGWVVLADKTTGTIQVNGGPGASVQTVPGAQLIGRAQARIVWAGKLLDFWHSVPGLITLVYIPAAIIAGSELLRLAHHYDRPFYHLRRYT